MKRPAALLLLALLLTACGEPVHGRVKDKHFEDGHYQPITTTHCTYSGKTTICVPTQQLIWYSDAWYLTVCNDDDGCTNVEVGQGIYDSTQVGDYYDEREVAQ